MLSYPIPEAEELLTNKLSAAQQSLSNCEEDLDFLREQVTVRFGPNETSTKAALVLKSRFVELLAFPFLLFHFPIADHAFPQTIEVATARVYNWDISQNRKDENDAAVSAYMPPSS